MKTNLDSLDLKATEKILLYYPTIDIPSPGWIRQGLMYWDKIGSIVPNSYDEHLPQDLRYSDEIQPLYNAKLFRPFDPGELFQRKADEAFRTEVLEILDSPDFASGVSGKKDCDTEVYVEKVNDRLFEDLKRRHLVSPQRTDRFIYFEENTAMVYMSTLAKISSRH